MHSLTHNFNLLEQYGVPYEFIFVEWNPLPEKTLLSEKLLEKYGKNGRNIRCYVCGSDVHEYYKNLSPTEVKFFEYHAKNVGIKRATQEFTFSTNSDIFLSEKIVSYLSPQTPTTLSSNEIFRARRLDCDLDHLGDEVVSEEYLKSKVIYSNDLSPPVYSNASGDFLLASTQLLHQLTGFDETVTTTILHQDSRLLYNALSQNIPISPLGDIYHFNHYNSYAIQGSAKEGLGSPDLAYSSNLPFSNITWGCSNTDVGLSPYPVFEESPYPHQKQLIKIGIKNEP